MCLNIPCPYPTGQSSDGDRIVGKRGIKSCPLDPLQNALLIGCLLPDEYLLQSYFNDADDDASSAWECRLRWEPYLRLRGRRSTRTTATSRRPPTTPMTRFESQRRLSRLLVEVGSDPRRPFIWAPSQTVTTSQSPRSLVLRGGGTRTHHGEGADATSPASRGPAE